MSSPFLQLQHQQEANYNMIDLESDRSLLEKLASRRQELLQQISNNSSNNNSNGSWIATRGGSFVLFQSEQAKDLISVQVKAIEEDIRNVCLRIKEFSGTQKRSNS